MSTNTDHRLVEVSLSHETPCNYKAYSIFRSSIVWASHHYLLCRIQEVVLTLIIFSIEWPKKFVRCVTCNLDRILSNWLDGIGKLIVAIYQNGLIIWHLNYTMCQLMVVGFFNRFIEFKLVDTFNLTVRKLCKFHMIDNMLLKRLCIGERHRGSHWNHWIVLCFIKEPLRISENKVISLITNYDFPISHLKVEVSVIWYTIRLIALGPIILKFFFFSCFKWLCWVYKMHSFVPTKQEKH